MSERKPMADTVRERELKFDVPDGWSPPDLSSLLPDGGRVETVVLSLDSEYHDTDARALLGSGVTLRRRTGGRDDTGWQLKIPDGDARLEVRVPLGGRGVPAELRRLTAGLRGRSALRPIAGVRVERTAHRLLDAAGSLLAEVAVDAVTAHTVREFAVTRTWDEVEVELGPAGGEKLLRRTAALLGQTAAVPSASRSKLARALGTPGLPEPDPSRLSGVVGSYLDAQFAVLVGGDVRLRQAVGTVLDPDLVHKVRVATRRYRSALRVFGPSLDAAQAAALDAELRWYAEALGRVRDRHVLREHLHDALGELDLSAAVVEAATATVDVALDADEALARAGLETVMDTARYAALLAALRDWRTDLPFTVDGPAREVDTFVRDAARAVRRRLRRADKLQRTDEDGRDEAFHRARKAAKRARYTAELAKPVLGQRAVEAARRAKKVQTRLGGRQDEVMAAQFLAGLCEVDAGGFALGVLYQRQRDAADRPA